MMGRAILWTSEVEDFQDGLWRRRALIPGAGLESFGYRSAYRADLDGDALDLCAAVLDLADPAALRLARRLGATDVPILLDASRALRLRPDLRGGPWTKAADLIKAARVIIAPDAASAQRLRRVAGKVPIVVAPDAAETPTSLRLAASAQGQDWSIEPLASLGERLVAWIVQPGDDARAEIVALPTLADALEDLGFGLLVIAPPDVLAQAKSLAPGVLTAAWSIESQLAQLSRVQAVVLPAEDGQEGGDWRVAAATALDLPVLERQLGEGVVDLGSGAAFGDWREALTALADGDLRPDKAAGTASSAAVDAALGWEEAIQGVRAAESRRPAAQPCRLLVFIDLMQDADLCLPIVREALQRGDFQVDVVVTRWLIERAPSVLSAFRRLGVEPRIVDREEVVRGEAPELARIDAFLTPVATNLNAHKRAQAVVERAAAMGIPTFSLQHGLENVGLNYFDDVHTEAVRVTTDHLFVWFPPDFAPPSPSWLKRKIIHVGTVRTASPPDVAPPMPEWPGPVVGVFENLHWHRYSDDFRKRFINDLFACARAAPDHLFVLKPHHGGQWASKSGVKGAPANLLLVNPGDPAWEPFTAPAIIAKADMVITTPSTVALDGAMADRPVAVVGYDLDLPLYHPLSVLRSTQDWISFVAGGKESPDQAALRQGFLRRTLVCQGAAPRLLSSLVDIVRGGL